MVAVCLLHPGAMGVSIGQAVAAGGREVRWVSEGRSAATERRATGAGFLVFATVGDALAGADVVVSVCPPAAAVDVATIVAGSGFAGLYVDANAIAPATARDVASVVSAVGATAVDGGIVGPPAHRAGTTRLFLSGDAADEAAALFSGSLVEAIPIVAPAGAASAAKVAYAAWTKGSAALLLAIAAFADAEGVTEPLRDEWARSQRDLADRLDLVAAGVTPKAWRFAGELADSGRAFADVGLPAGFGEAAADVFGRLASFRDDSGGDIDEAIT